MSMTAFEVFGVLKLNKDSFEAGLDAAERSARGAGSKVGGALVAGAKVGVAALAAGTTAAIGFSKQAVQAGSAFDQAMGSVAATMGKDVSALQGEGAEVAAVDTAYGHFEGTLREFAMFMGGNTVFSATQAAGALNYMALAGYNVEESMQMLPSVLSMAAAGQMELSKASDMITDSQMALGISFDRTQQMVNEFAKAASSGNTSVEQLAEAFLRVGALGREVNGGMVTLADGTEVALDGVQQLEVAFTAMANRGIKGAEAGTHMRNMLLKLSSPTDKGAAALQELGVAVFDDTGKMRALSDIFGDMNANMTDIRPVIKKTYEQIKTMSKDDFAKALEAGTLQLDYFGVALVDDNNKLRDWNAIMMDINDTFNNGALTQEQKIGAISEMFNTRDLASAQGLLAAMTEDFGKLAVAVTDTEGAADKMSQTKLDNLNGDLTLFKSALETAHITLNDQLSPSLREFVQTGTQGLQMITNGFNEGGLEGAMEAFGEFLSIAINGIIEKLPGFIEAGGKVVAALGQGLFDNLDKIIEAGLAVADQLAIAFVNGIPKLIEAFLRIITAFLQAIDDNFDEIMEMGAQLLEGIATAITNNLPALLKVAKSIILKLVDALAKNLPAIMKWIADALKKAAAWVTENMGPIIDTALTIIEALVNGLVENLPELLEGAIALILALAQGIIDNLPKLIEKAPVIVQKLTQAIIDNLPLLLDATIKLILMLVEGILQNLDKIVVAAIEIVLALIQGILQALPQLLEAAIKLVLDLVGSILSCLPDVLGAGVKIVAELISGIVGALGDVIGAGLEIVGSIIAGIVEGFLDIVDSGKKMVAKFGEGVKNVIADAVQWGKDLVMNFVDGIMSGAEWLYDKVTGLAKGIKDRLGFSEPKIGPLSDFHTYAPDMMHLFAKGIEDNKGMLLNTVEDAFNFESAIADANDELNANMGDLELSGGISAGKSDRGFSGSIIIPVYIGDKQIDEIFVDARKRVNMRSGGMA